MDHAIVADAKGARAIVAFETDCEDCRPLQHFRIGRPMRHVTGFASVDAHGGVFIDKRTALVAVAFEARFLISFLLIDHAGARRHSPGGGKGAVRIVAVRTYDHAFIDPMFERHGELRFHRSVTGIAELGLFVREKEFRRFRVMDGVAVGADHIFLGMNAPSDIGSRKSLRVAAETGVESFLWSDLGERLDGRLAAAGFNVGFPGPVATFAPGIFGRLLATSDTLIMGIAKELIPERGVTGLTGLTADIVGALRESGQKESGLSHSKERHLLII